MFHPFGDVDSFYPCTHLLISLKPVSYSNSILSPLAGQSWCIVVITADRIDVDVAVLFMYIVGNMYDEINCTWKVFHVFHHDSTLK